MDAFFRHVPVLLVFLTLSAASWLYGGTRPDAMLPVIPWLWALLFEVMLFFPQRRPYEDPVSARRRVCHKLGRDPLLMPPDRDAEAAITRGITSLLNPGNVSPRMVDWTL